MIGHHLLAIGVAAAVSPPAALDTVDVEVVVVIARQATEKFDQRVAVDPRPVWLGGQKILPDSSDYVSMRTEDVLARADRLRLAGLDGGTSLPFVSDCDPVMAPPGYKHTFGCPAEPEVVLVIGAELTPAPGADGVWEIRKLELYYGPSGRSGVLYRVSLRSTADGCNWSGEQSILYID